MPGIEIRVDPQNNEIMYKGRNTMMGYLKLPQDTLRTLDSEGWIHTGDQGVKDSDGFLKVTGRIKELIVTAGGENISPVIIENKVMELSSIFSSCVAIGDKRKFISLLICIRCEMTPDGESTHKLAPDVKRFLKTMGSTAETIEQAMTDEKVKAYIDGVVEKYNEVAVSRAQQIRKWCILPEEFTIGRGELTATMKLRRAVVQEHYAKEIDAMYQWLVCGSRVWNKAIKKQIYFLLFLGRFLEQQHFTETSTMTTITIITTTMRRIRLHTWKQPQKLLDLYSSPEKLPTMVIFFPSNLMDMSEVLPTEDFQPANRSTVRRVQEMSWML